MSTPSGSGRRLSDAWHEWLKSEEGRQCTDPALASTLRPEDMQYVRNRLWRAFMAGAALGREAVEVEEL